MIKKKSLLRKKWVNPVIREEKVKINFFFSRSSSRSIYGEDSQGRLLAGMTCDFCDNWGPCGSC